jgi:hypothetical protein
MARTSFAESGEPGRNRTFNPQIERTNGGDPLLSTSHFTVVSTRQRLLIRPPVSACD